MLERIKTKFKRREPLSAAIPVAPKATDVQPIQMETVKIYPEISLEEEGQRQATNLASLFAKELKFKTPQEYIATLPQFEPQPEQFKGRFDVPVIVETRISLKRMLELTGIVAYFNPDSIKNWKESKFKTPKTPYTAWVNDGTPNLNKSVNAVRKSLKADERGGNTHDGIALYLKDPEILDNHYLDLPGSQVGSDHAPFLNHWHGRPKLYHRFVDDEGPGCGSVVAGKL